MDVSPLRSRRGTTSRRPPDKLLSHADANHPLSFIPRKHIMCGENVAISASGLAFPGGQSGPFLIAGCPTARSIYLVAWEGIHSARCNKSNLSKRRPTRVNGRDYMAAGFSAAKREWSNRAKTDCTCSHSMLTALLLLFFSLFRSDSLPFTIHTAFGGSKGYKQLSVR